MSSRRYRLSEKEKEIVNGIQPKPFDPKSARPNFRGLRHKILCQYTLPNGRILYEVEEGRTVYRGRWISITGLMREDGSWIIS